MPWRLIGILLILTFFVIFSGFNSHKITIYFGPFSFSDIPLFVALVAMFILGAFTALPFSIAKSIKKVKQAKKNKKPDITSMPPKLEEPREQHVLPEKEEKIKQKKKPKKK